VADGSRVSKAIIGACVFICLHDKTKTAETNKSPNNWHTVSPSRYLANQLKIGQKVKDRGHTVTKCKQLAIEWPACVMHSIECPVFKLYRLRFFSKKIVYKNIK